MEIKYKVSMINMFLQKLSEHINEDDTEVEKIRDLISELKWENNRYGDNTEKYLFLDNYSIKELEVLRDAFKDCDARKNVKILNMLIDSLKNPSTTAYSDLRIFAEALVKYVDDFSEHKWLFRKEDICNVEYIIPYLLYHVDYVPERKVEGYFYEAHVDAEIHTNDIKGYRRQNIHFYFSDISGRTLTEILTQQKMFIETPELYEDYQKSVLKYENRIKEQGTQYKCFQYVSKDGYSNRFISTKENDNIFEFYHVINDMRGDNRHWVKQEDCHLYRSYKKKREKDFFCKDYYDLPIMPFLFGYNLDTHSECYFHVDDIENYEYDHSLRDKLVLPESHKNLLDILVNNSSILKGDIINNKGNGTVVILEGPPGCGKTLTTEVYSELMNTPLYKVTAGELGTNPKEMEKTLYEVLNKAQRLGCIILIDECETFVRKRAEDLTQNAIITTFLRQLEYFNGIMFLTSNKIKDIDDAILSRCIAAIRYEEPTEENAKKIWRILSKQFELDKQITDELINKLVKVFPKAVGRDIKELLKLTARYCLGLKKDIDIEAFLACAQFRYIDVNEQYVEELKNKEVSENE